jgi:hypothetical protein
MILVGFSCLPLKLRALDLARIISYPAISIAPCIELPDTAYTKELPQGNLISNSRCDAANYRNLIHSERPR